MNFLSVLLGGKNQKHLKNIFCCCYDLGTKTYCVYTGSGKLVRTFETEGAMDMWINIKRMNREKCVIAKLVYPLFSSETTGEDS